MKRLATAAMALVGLVGGTLAACAVAGSTPDIREVFEVLRTNLPDVGETELNRAAVDGLLKQLHGRASLVDAAGPTNPTVQKFFVIERSIAVARVTRVDATLAGALAGEIRAATATNKLKGLVLDLRFAAGDDYAAVVPLAELFVAKDRELLDWGDGPVKSSAPSVTIDVPLTVLVNQETLGAPEAAAGVLRECDVALIIGNPTAGRALAGREFTLASGQKLRVASTPVKLGDGSEIPATGLKPDITVVVTLEQERTLALEPFGSEAGTATNAASIRPGRSRRPSEAELVRERRAITNQPGTAPARELPVEKLVIVDPVLARAVDLLKGLAVVRGDRSRRIQD